MAALPVIHLCDLRCDVPRRYYLELRLSRSAGGLGDDPRRRTDYLRAQCTRFSGRPCPRERQLGRSPAKWSSSSAQRLRQSTLLRCIYRLETIDEANSGVDGFQIHSKCDNITASAKRGWSSEFNQFPNLVTAMSCWRSRSCASVTKAKRRDGAQVSSRSASRKSARFLQALRRQQQRVRLPRSGYESEIMLFDEPNRLD